MNTQQTKLNLGRQKKNARARLAAIGNLRTIETLPFLRKEKFNMKSWLRNKVRDWLTNSDIEPSAYTAPNVRHLEDFSLGVIKARGGTIISVRKYDRDTGEEDTTLHLIPDDTDFKLELANIITMEALRS